MTELRSDQFVVDRGQGKAYQMMSISILTSHLDAPAATPGHFSSDSTPRPPPLGALFALLLVKLS